MNNLEKLKTLDAENFWNAVQKLNSSTVREYVDFIAYLNSEDDNLMHFLKSKGDCKVVPSEMEIINCLTHGREITESEKRIYISQHTKKAVVLDKMIRFGKTYLKVVTEDGILESVPEELVIMEEIS